MVTTFGAPEVKKGVYVLKSDFPTGPFEIYSERLTPANWSCIDGTIYTDSDSLYLGIQRFGEMRGESQL